MLVEQLDHVVDPRAEGSGRKPRAFAIEPPAANRIVSRNLVSFCGSSSSTKVGFQRTPFWSMLVAGLGLRAPIPLGHYRLPLRCQTIMIVNLPISGSSTSNLIIEILLSASKGRPGREPGFPESELQCFSQEPVLPISTGKDSACTVRQSAPGSPPSAPAANRNVTICPIAPRDFSARIC
jgi:hypothetical protein